MLIYQKVRSILSAILSSRWSSDLWTLTWMLGLVLISPAILSVPKTLRTLKISWKSILQTPFARFSAKVILCKKDGDTISPKKRGNCNTKVSFSMRWREFTRHRRICSPRHLRSMPSRILFTITAMVAIRMRSLHFPMKKSLTSTRNFIIRPTLNFSRTEI